MFITGYLIRTFNFRETIFTSERNTEWSMEYITILIDNFCERRIFNLLLRKEKLHTLNCTRGRCKLARILFFFRFATESMEAYKMHFLLLNPFSFT